MKNGKFLASSSTLTIGAALFLAIQPTSAVAFTLNLTGGDSGIANTGWGTNTVTFDIDTSCNSYLTTVERSIDTAISTWGSVPTSALEIKRGATTSLPNAITTYVGSSATSYAPIGNTVVYCDANFATNSGASADSIPGYATGINYTSTGRIQGCLLVLNVQSGGQANITTLDSTLTDVVLTHEIGHCLGFGHSADTQALMYYQTGAGRKSYLTKDDIDAVTFLYPREEPGSGGFMGCNSVQSISGPGSGGGPGSPRGAVELLGLLVAIGTLVQLGKALTKNS